MYLSFRRLQVKYKEVRLGYPMITLGVLPARTTFPTAPRCLVVEFGERGGYFGVSGDIGMGEGIGGYH